MPALQPKDAADPAARARRLSTKAFALRARAAHLWSRALALNPDVANKVKDLFLQQEQPQEDEVDSAPSRQPRPRDGDTGNSGNWSQALFEQQEEPAAKKRKASDERGGPDPYAGLPAEDEARRTVVMKTCKFLSLSLPLVQRVLPGVCDLRLVKKNREFSGTAFLVFGTEAEAKAAAARDTVEISHRKCFLKRLEPRRFGLEDRRACSVRLANLPDSVTDADIHTAFADVRHVRYIGSYASFSGTAFVTFGSPQSAAAAVERQSVDIGGNAVEVHSANNRPPNPSDD